MSKLSDFLCNDKDYFILRGQKVTKQVIEQMFDECSNERLSSIDEKLNTMEKDFRNMTENYWYVIRCWRNKTSAFDSEFDEMEKYCKDIISKYKFI